MFNSNNESNDDDDLFASVTSSASTNLANLFGGDTPVSPELKNSLTYTPPKQPKSTSATQQPVSNQKRLICMKTITLSKLIDTNYSALGKFGFAIIADSLSSDLIIYKTKQNILSSTRLCSSFRCNLISELVITFVDDQKESWMITFDNTKDKMEIVEELAKHGISLEIKQNEQAKSTSNNEIYNRKLVAEKPEEDLQDSEKQRADILGRISKMGLSILPTADAASLAPTPAPVAKPATMINVELSESEPEEVIRTAKTRKVRARHSESSIETMDLVKSSTGAQIKPFTAMHHHHHQLMDPLNIYFAENRTHNSEVRMNLTQLSNKIDLLLGELRPQPQLSERDLLEKRLADLERRLSQQTTQMTGSHTQDFQFERKVEELKKENAQNVLKYDEMVTNLRREVDMLKNSILETNSIHDEKLSIVESEKSKIADENKALNERVRELEALVENQKLKLDDFASYVKQQEEDKLTRLQRENALQRERQTREMLEQRLQDLSQKYKNLEESYNALVQSSPREEEHFGEMVKQSMNTMYQNVLADSMESTSNYDVRELKRILQKQLKSATFAIIEQFSKVRNEHVRGNVSIVSSVSPEFEVTV